MDNFERVATATTEANIGEVVTENETEKANTRSVGYSSGSSDIVTVSFSTIAKIGEICIVVSNVKAIRVKIIGVNVYFYNANLMINRV